MLRLQSEPALLLTNSEKKSRPFESSSISKWRETPSALPSACPENSAQEHLRTHSTHSEPSRCSPPLLIALSQNAASLYCQWQPWGDCGYHQRSRMLDASTKISHSLVFMQNQWPESHVLCIHVVPENHLAQSRTAIVQHLSGVRRWG